MGYWIEIGRSAFWKSLLFFFDDPKKALILFVLGAAVPTLIVRLFRSKEAFTEHWKSNIAIPVAGGICTWLLIFVYYLLVGPVQETEELRLRLANSDSNKRSAITAREGAETQVRELDRLRNLPVILHGACKVREEQLNPARAQQSCPGAPPPTWRDRVVAINARLTEADRNRLSIALSEFEQSLKQGDSLFYKIVAEGNKVEHGRQDRSIARDFAAHQKALTDLANGEGQEYYKLFPALRSKWHQSFEDQTSYIFGDNPDNEGPGALLNAASGYTNYLDSWKAIQNKDNDAVLTLLALANNDLQARLKVYSTWHGQCVNRLAEMRNSIR
jgi:hypothetical protein